MGNKRYENIIYEKKPPIAYITFNRPEKMNAFNNGLQLEVRDALEDAGWEDDKIRVIILRGAGRCFSTGFDISTVLEGNAVQVRAHILKGLKGKGFDATAFWDVFWNNPKPLIAQVHSFCLAAGMGAATFCDLRICSEDALFGYPHIRSAGPEMTAIWPWILGMSKAKELLYTGNLMDAQEAWRLGYVSKVVQRDRLEEEVDKLAQTIAKVPVVVNEFSKKLVNMAYELMNVRTVLERAGELQAMCVVSPESLPERAEFDRLRREKGLKAALDWRNSRFAEEDAWWKTRETKPDERGM